MVPQGARDALASFLVAALHSVRDFYGATDAEGTYAEFRAMVTVHLWVLLERGIADSSELHKLYSSQDGNGDYAYPCLNGLVVEVCHRLVELSATVSFLSFFRS